MKMTNSIKQFEVGKEYSMRSACNYDCVWTYKVIARTKCTVTLTNKRKDQITCRIIKKFTEMDNVEQVRPLGNYSMAPILRAE